MDLASYKWILNTSSTAAKYTLKSISLLTEHLRSLLFCVHVNNLDTYTRKQFLNFLLTFE